MHRSIRWLQRSAGGVFNVGQESTELEPWQFWFSGIGALVGAATLLISDPPISVLDCFGKLLGGMLGGAMLGMILSYFVALLPLLGLAALVYGFYKHVWLGITAFAGLLALGLVLRWKAKRSPQADDESIGLKSISPAHSQIAEPQERQSQLRMVMETTDNLGQRTPASIDSALQQSKWDVFISHASEDKLAVARPLAELLKAQGIAVWLDEYELKVGDSLRKKIDTGLSQSRFGVVVLSRNFFAKEWPQRELNGLISRESEINKVVIPVWHQVDHDYVAQFSPILADKLAADTRFGIEVVAKKILSAIRVV